MNNFAPSDLDLDLELAAPQRIATGDSDEILFLARLWRAVWRARLWILAAALVGGFMGGLYSFTVEPRYTAEAQVMLETSDGPRDAFSPNAPALTLSPTTLESEIEVMRSPDLIDSVARQLDLYEDPEFVGEEEGARPTPEVMTRIRGAIAALLPGREAESEGRPEIGPDDERSVLLDQIAQAVEVEQLGNLSAVYAIRFTSDDREKSAEVANALAETYIEAQTTQLLQARERSREWLVAQANEAEAELARLHEEMQAHVLSAADVEDLTLLQSERRLTSERLDDLNETIAGLQALVELPADAEDAALIEALRGAPEPPRDLSAALDAVTTTGDASQLRAIFAREREGWAAELLRQNQLAQSLGQSLAELEGRIRAQVDYDATLRRLENRITIAETVQASFEEMLRQQFGESQLIEPRARVISTARLPLHPSEPSRKKLAALGGILASLTVLVAAALREARNTRLRTMREVEEATGLPILGVVPALGGPGTTVSGLLSRPQQPHPILLRSMRWARAQISARALARGLPEPRVLVGSSSVAGEDKSLALLLLAMSYAESGERVLLVDLDVWRSGRARLRRPALADPAKLDEPGGLETYLHEVPGTSLDVLRALPEHDDTAEFLASPFMQKAIGALSNRYGRIVIDAPPVLPSVDALSLFLAADATLLVTRWNATKAPLVRSTVAALSDLGIRPLGCLVTHLDLARAPAYADDQFAHLATAYRSGA